MATVSTTYDWNASFIFANYNCPYCPIRDLLNYFKDDLLNHIMSLSLITLPFYLHVSMLYSLIENRLCQ